MTIKIKIHGRDVEFTDEPPARAGAYWWTFNGNAPPRALEVYEHHEDLELMAFGRGIHGALSDVGGLWSHSLVPVTEVERAWDESAKASMLSGGPQPAQWHASRACRVVEGLE